jgi:hypothetical protein
MISEILATVDGMVGEGLGRVYGSEEGDRVEELSPVAMQAADVTTVGDFAGLSVGAVGLGLPRILGGALPNINVRPQTPITTFNLQM